MNVKSLIYIHGLLEDAAHHLENQVDAARRSAGYWAERAQGAPEDAGVQKEHQEAVKRYDNLAKEHTEAKQALFDFLTHEWR